MPERNSRRRAVAFIIKSRAERRRFFPDALFGEPAWDILLIVYAAALDQRSASMADLREAAAVETSTLERWLVALEKDGLIVRSSETGLFSLSEQGWLTMDSYFESMSSGMI